MIVKNSMVPDPLEITEDTGIWEMVDRLLENGQGALPVIDARRKLIGIVSIHDILARVVPNYVHMDTKLMEVMHEGYFEERMSARGGLTARDLMNRTMDTVRPEEPVIRAVAIFVEQRRKALPVVDRDGHFVGLITRTSVLKRLREKMNLKRGKADA